MSVWSPKLNKSFTDGSIKVPIQTQRGRSRTVLGAVGGNYTQGLVHWAYAVADSTNTQDVFNFLSGMLDQAHFPSHRITIVLDRHSSHRSALVRSLQQDRGVELIYTPVSSCALNNVENVWALFKKKWQRLMASSPLALDFNRLDQLVADTAGQLG